MISGLAPMSQFKKMYSSLKEFRLGRKRSNDLGNHIYLLSCIVWLQNEIPTSVDISHLSRKLEFKAKVKIIRYMKMTHFYHHMQQCSTNV